jgi:hypothetical protein
MSHSSAKDIEHAIKRLLEIDDSSPTAARDRLGRAPTLVPGMAPETETQTETPPDADEERPEITRMGFSLWDTYRR